mmetsp:Transcript_16119/g.18611  ORF Transcript_16119/g.18611 Transcript_16119/m.18611 type:complete len:227 (+) Transcript_16119:158-838(+)|eukprot:CAMPEP_0194140250 /NCGR_PEP_ID=MMETSP0152-20130528/9809_1 /TAXON_ID=1049557 /ORGANISM="Thalassiothrix antarctica, Strain L6-D1" /LENGTH=226 /DNA_ID=CAMNT_0038838421 /DNA_START=68 /DNA_END=748 /DNA_ORIENTATION=-
MTLIRYSFLCVAAAAITTTSAFTVTQQKTKSLYRVNAINFNNNNNFQTQLRMADDEKTTSVAPLEEEIEIMSILEGKLGINDVVLGSGDKATEDGDQVKVKYSGRILTSGVEFDNGMIYFTLGDNKVIKGWEQGLLGMKVGGKRIIQIPYELGYGEKGFAVIPPKADLEFTIELDDIASNPVTKFASANELGNNPKTYVIGLVLFVAIFLPQIVAVIAGVSKSLGL